MSSSHNKDVTSRVTNLRIGTERAISALAAIAVALLLAVPAASVFGVSDHAQAAPKYVLRIGFMQPVDSLNPFVGFTEASRFFYSLVYDCLQSVSNDLEPVPNLAMAWWVVPESDPALVTSGEPYGSVWQYNLTRNAKWHDGQPFTADDVVFSFNLQCQNYDIMWMYEPYTFSMRYSEKVDNYTVRMHFYNRVTGESVPIAYGNILSMPILPKHRLGNMSPQNLTFSWIGVSQGETHPLVGTGPYMATSTIFDEWIDGDYITLVRNLEYHQSEDRGLEPIFDKIVLYFYDDATAMKIALETAVLDIAELPVQEFEAVEDDVREGTLRNVVTYGGLTPTGQFTYISFYLGGGGGYGPLNPVTVDPAVRKALTMATNKTHIAETFYLGRAEEGSTMISPMRGDWHYEPTASERLDYDPDAAASLFESSGYVDTNGDDIREATSACYAVQHGFVSEGSPLNLAMAARTKHPEEKDMAAYLAIEWAKIGVDLEIVLQSDNIWPTCGGVLCPYNMDMGVVDWTSDIDPSVMLFRQIKNDWNGWSDNGYFNAEYDENYTASVNALDGSQRIEHVRNCERIHYLDAAYLILVYNYQTYAWRNDTIRDEHWGNWSAQPGRSLDNVWGAHPLLLGEHVDNDGGISLPFYVKFLIGAGVIIVVAIEAVLVYNKHKKASPPKSP